MKKRMKVFELVTTCYKAKVLGRKNPVQMEEHFFLSASYYGSLLEAGDGSVQRTQIWFPTNYLLEFSLHRAISVIHIAFLLSLAFPNFSFKPELHFKSMLSGKEKNYSIYMCIYIEARKMVLMNLFAGQEYRRWPREWTCRRGAGLGGKERLGQIERAALTCIPCRTCHS